MMVSQHRISLVDISYIKLTRVGQPLVKVKYCAVAPICFVCVELYGIITCYWITLLATKLYIKTLLQIVLSTQL